jgi:hypothetical protein
LVIEVIAGGLPYDDAQVIELPREAVADDERG